MRRVTREHLRSARKRLRLTVAQAAAEVHVAPRTWVNWESGAVEVPDTAAHLFSMLHGLKWRPRQPTKKKVEQPR